MDIDSSNSKLQITAELSMLQKKLALIYPEAYSLGMIDTSDLDEKIAHLTSTSRYSNLLTQLYNTRDQGELMGRVLEVNFADRFEQENTPLQYGTKQTGCCGDIVFL